MTNQQEVKEETYRSMTTFEQKNFISQIIDLLLYSPYFYRELKVFINDYKEAKNLQELRRTTIPIFSGDVQVLLPKAAFVQPQQDYTLTSEYKTKERLQQYYRLREDYLAIHPLCEAQLQGCGIESDQIHHKAGRIGTNLFNHFLAVCSSCHHYIEMNPEEAKQLGFSQTRL